MLDPQELLEVSTAVIDSAATGEANGDLGGELGGGCLDLFRRVATEGILRWRTQPNATLTMILAFRVSRLFSR